MELAVVEAHFEVARLVVAPAVPSHPRADLAHLRAAYLPKIPSLQISSDGHGCRPPRPYSPLRRDDALASCASTAPTTADSDRVVRGARRRLERACCLRLEHLLGGAAGRGSATRLRDGLARS